MNLSELGRYFVGFLVGACVVLLFSSSSGCSGVPTPAINWEDVIGVRGSLSCQGEAAVLMLGSPIASVQGSSGIVGTTAELDGLVCAGVQIRVGPFSWRFSSSTQADERCQPFASSLRVTKGE